MLALAASLLAACVTYSEETGGGALVRHHFGYVKVVTPPVRAEDAPVRVLAIETIGVWLNVDSRPAQEDPLGVGGGFGYQHDHREFIPLDCRMVVRVANQQQMAAFIDMWKAGNLGEKGLCVTQDSSL